MAKTYRTIQNDSFDAIAYRIWGNEHMCHQLMAANPDYMDALLFEPGIELNVPDMKIEPRKADLPPWYEEN